MAACVLADLVLWVVEGDASGLQRPNRRIFIPSIGSATDPVGAHGPIRDDECVVWKPEMNVTSLN